MAETFLKPRSQCLWKNYYIVVYYSVYRKLMQLCSFFKSPRFSSLNWLLIGINNAGLLLLIGLFFYLLELHGKDWIGKFFLNTMYFFLTVMFLLIGRLTFRWSPFFSNWKFTCVRRLFRNSIDLSDWNGSCSLITLQWNENKSFSLQKPWNADKNQE